MNRRVPLFVAVGAALLLYGCSSTRQTVESNRKQPPLFKGMGGHHYEVTTASNMAQRYFDQGLTWSYAFNHDEAIRSFTEATRLDPECAMAWWGIALCNGPHINNPILPPDRAAAAWDALQQAVTLKGRVTPKERALITALQERYGNPPPEDRAPLDRAYADAMREVWRTYPDDSNIGALFAEAMMDLRPWDLWKKDGTPQPGTEEVLATLEQVFHQDPLNPLANHLYIHAVEASPHPTMANAAADRLRDMVPASGHLTHMPSHIDVLTGRWAQASAQNERAIKADRKYTDMSPKQGFYRLYMIHNHHMLSFAAMMQGRSKVAIRSAREVVDSVPKDYAHTESALVDPYMHAKYDVLKRFGLWDEILAEPAPPSFLRITTAMWRFDRGLAFANKKQLDNAERERAAFEDAVLKIPDDAMMAINPAKTILSIARHMLDAEIEYHSGRSDAAIESLKKAVAVEDSLIYMEPPEWVQPVRHTLGAILLSAGRYGEAETVYRADLRKWPGNGWSLFGLARSLHGQGKAAEAKIVEARFNKAWSNADTKILSSCLCVPKT